MSAISGIFYQDQRPVTDAVIEAMADASQMAGPDAVEHVRPRSGLVLQTNLLHFDRSSEIERQPWLFAQGSVLTWDGRLDNRDDLLVQLERQLGAARTDAAIVAAAYERWGLESLRRLIGDWSLAIWDAAKEQIVLARDYMGNRPLYCLERSGLIAWATCLDALVDGFQLQSEPSESFIAARFLDRVPDNMAPFSGVKMLAAGHHMIASGNGTAAVTRYWTFTPGTVTFRRHEDCTDRLRELLTDAVRVRLRTNKTIWSHLSGGWDSSTVVCLAHRLILAGGVEAPALQPVTLTWTRSRECDEANYVTAVERWCGLSTTFHEWDGYADTNKVLQGQRRPLGWIQHYWEEPVRRAGGRIVLTGWLGDSLMLAPMYTPAIAIEDLLRGHALRFLRLATQRATLGHVGILSILKRLWTYEIALRRRSSPPPKPVPGVSPALLAKAPEITAPPMPPLAAAGRANRILERAMYQKAQRNIVLSSDSAPDLWTTHPYSHRPLIEFLLAAPATMLWDFSGPRPSMRRALIGVLPPETLDRTTKVNTSIAWERSRRRVEEDLKEIERFLGLARTWQIVAMGYVEIPALSAALAAPESRFAFLRACVEIEVWLRALADMSRRRGIVRTTDDSATRAAVLSAT